MPVYFQSPVQLPDIADGAQILNSTTETIMCPDYTFQAYDPRIFAGAAFNVRAAFDVSNVVTTPGTLTFRLRWGGVGGTILAQSAAIALSTTARSNYTGLLDIDLVWRVVNNQAASSSTAFAIGKVFLNDVPAGADSAPQSIYTMTSAGANVPAAVASLDTTIAKALSLTAQFSVNTATTQLTNHIRILTAYGS